MKTAGYSGTPLAKKLGLKSNFRIKLVNQPDYYFNLFTDLPPGIQQIDDFSIKKDFIHYFTKNAAQFNKDINLLKFKKPLK